MSLTKGFLKEEIIVEILRQHNNKKQSVNPSNGTFPSNGYVWQNVKMKKRRNEQLNELKKNIIRYERRKRFEIVKAELGKLYLEDLGKMLS